MNLFKVQCKLLIAFLLDFLGAFLSTPYARIDMLKNPQIKYALINNFNLLIIEKAARYRLRASFFMIIMLMPQLSIFTLTM